MSIERPTAPGTGEPPPHDAAATPAGIDFETILHELAAELEDDDGHVSISGPRPPASAAPPLTPPAPTAPPVPPLPPTPLVGDRPAVFDRTRSGAFVGALAGAGPSFPPGAGLAAWEQWFLTGFFAPLVVVRPPVLGEVDVTAILLDGGPGLHSTLLRVLIFAADGTLVGDGFARLDLWGRRMLIIDGDWSHLLIGPARDPLRPPPAPPSVPGGESDRDDPVREAPPTPPAPGEDVCLSPDLPTDAEVAAVPAVPWDQAETDQGADLVADTTGGVPASADGAAGLPPIDGCADPSRPEVAPPQPLPDVGEAAPPDCEDEQAAQVEDPAAEAPAEAAEDGCAAGSAEGGAAEAGQAPADESAEDDPVAFPPGPEAAEPPPPMPPPPLTVDRILIFPPIPHGGPSLTFVGPSSAYSFTPLEDGAYAVETVGGAFLGMLRDVRSVTFEDGTFNLARLAHGRVRALQGPGEDPRSVLAVIGRGLPRATNEEEEGAAQARAAEARRAAEAAQRSRPGG